MCVMFHPASPTLSRTRRAGPGMRAPTCSIGILPPPGDRARRRSLFGGRPETTPPPVTAGLSPSAAERTELVITAYQEMIQEQLDEGLRSIQHAANALMHEIAGEVWRSAGGDKEAVGSTILQELSRDQAIRALIAHSDERFQALAARTGRVEDTMNMLAESVRAAREQIARSADALAESGRVAAPRRSGIGQIRAQLDEVSRQVAAAFQTLADRDQEIVDTLHLRIREHGELVVQETARISQAMQEYVQQGVETMGHLAGQRGLEHAGDVGARRRGGSGASASVDQQISELAEQLQLLYDRTGIAMTLAARVRDVPRRPDGGRGARAARGHEPGVRGSGDRAREPRPFGLRGAPSRARHRRPRRTTRRSPGCWTSGCSQVTETLGRLGRSGRCRSSSTIRWPRWPRGPTNRRG